MKKNVKANPTEAEMEVLQILWKYGPSSVKFVNDKLGETKNVGYTTTLKIMQIMTDKNLVNRTKEGKKHIYEARLKEKETQKLILDKILSTAFGGSAMNLVMQALGNKKTSKEELQKIKDLINELEKKQNESD